MLSPLQKQSTMLACQWDSIEEIYDDIARKCQNGTATASEIHSLPEYKQMEHGLLSSSVGSSSDEYSKEDIASSLATSPDDSDEGNVTMTKESKIIVDINESSEDSKDCGNTDVKSHDPSMNVTKDTPIDALHPEHVDETPVAYREPSHVDCHLNEACICTVALAEDGSISLHQRLYNIVELEVHKRHGRRRWDSPKHSPLRIGMTHAVDGIVESMSVPKSVDYEKYDYRLFRSVMFSIIGPLKRRSQNDDGIDSDMDVFRESQPYINQKVTSHRSPHILHIKRCCSKYTTAKQTGEEMDSRRETVPLPSQPQQQDKVDLQEKSSLQDQALDENRVEQQSAIAHLTNAKHVDNVCLSCTEDLNDFCQSAKLLHRRECFKHLKKAYCTVCEEDISQLPEDALITHLEFCRLQLTPFFGSTPSTEADTLVSRCLYCTQNLGGLTKDALKSHYTLNLEDIVNGDDHLECPGCTCLLFNFDDPDDAISHLIRCQPEDSLTDSDDEDEGTTEETSLSGNEGSVNNIEDARKNWDDTLSETEASDGLHAEFTIEENCKDEHQDRLSVVRALEESTARCRYIYDHIATFYPTCKEEMLAAKTSIEAVQQKVKDISSKPVNLMPDTGVDMSGYEILHSEQSKGEGFEDADLYNEEKSEEEDSSLTENTQDLGDYELNLDNELAKPSKTQAKGNHALGPDSRDLEEADGRLHGDHLVRNKSLEWEASSEMRDSQIFVEHSVSPNIQFPVQAMHLHCSQIAFGSKPSKQRHQPPASLFTCEDEPEETKETRLPAQTPLAEATNRNAEYLNKRRMQPNATITFGSYTAAFYVPPQPASVSSPSLPPGSGLAKPSSVSTAHVDDGYPAPSIAANPTAQGQPGENSEASQRAGWQESQTHAGSTITSGPVPASAEVADVVTRPSQSPRCQDSCPSPKRAADGIKPLVVSAELIGGGCVQMRRSGIRKVEVASVLGIARGVTRLSLLEIVVPRALDCSGISRRARSSFLENGEVDVD